MQPKVCLVLFSFATFNRAWTRILHNLGIDYTLCIATSSTTSANIQTPQGVFSASSANLRNYFRQFDAVILCDHTNNLSATSLINYSVFWLSWNDPEDPAFLFFNPHFSTAITDSTYNSNFPSDYNHAVELLENMDAIVQLLPDVLYWGTITDVMDHRERVMEG